MARSKKSSMDFEASLATLESTIHKMENQELTLEEALRCFEDGVNLVQACQKALEEAEQKIQVITNRMANPHL
ncbi:MAG: exodeoxyribonuclease small subunit [Gammaproteobacteria bacterium]|jgi:exodeoxyribonuclease VII small subunit|nr:exodeoxyribonuclease small subunit [Gammaproteobacteria bacterium]